MIFIKFDKWNMCSVPQHFFFLQVLKVIFMKNKKFFFSILLIFIVLLDIYNFKPTETNSLKKSQEMRQPFQLETGSAINS